MCSVLKALGAGPDSLWLMSSLRSHVASEKRLFFLFVFIVSDVVSSSCIFTRREALYSLPGGGDKLPTIKVGYCREMGGLGGWGVGGGYMVEGGAAVRMHRLNCAHCFQFQS